jgi:homoserine acetyltransferase
VLCGADESSSESACMYCPSPSRDPSRFQVEEYLRYQGEKFNKRSFDAESYVRLTQLMDSHDIARGRGEYLAVLASIKTPFLIVGITSDILYVATMYNRR